MGATISACGKQIVRWSCGYRCWIGRAPPTDGVPDHQAPMLHDRLDMDSIRLALAVDGRRVYIGRGVDEDELYQFFWHSSGGGGSGGPRSVLASHGAKPAWSSGGNGRCFAYGIVADSVIAVRVDGIEAVLENNAFLVEVPSSGGPVVVTTADGEREFPRPPTMRPLRTTAESTTGPDGRGYEGMVEYAQSGLTDLEIDDLDARAGAARSAGRLLDQWQRTEGVDRRCRAAGRAPGGAARAGRPRGQGCGDSAHPTPSSSSAELRSVRIPIRRDSRPRCSD